jgi:hypothetical protein
MKILLAFAKFCAGKVENSKEAESIAKRPRQGVGFTLLCFLGFDSHLRWYGNCPTPIFLNPVAAGPCGQQNTFLRRHEKDFDSTSDLQPYVFH